MFGLPLLILERPGATLASGPKSTTAAASASQQRGDRHLRRMMLVSNRVPAPTTTTTTTAPAAPAPVAAPAPAPVRVPTAPAPQVRVIPAPTTTTRPLSSATGLATWYHWAAGQCASPTLPKGTTVFVRNPATGATTSCVVTDREANNPGRIIDLDTSVFSQIAPLSAGAVTVIISW